MKPSFSIALVVLLCGSVHGQNQTTSAANKGAPSGRIVNGQSVSIQSYPFIASLHTSSSFCGATIISYKNAVTAAHCLEDHPSKVMLRAGSSKTNVGGYTFQVAQWIIHPGYDPDTFDNDAAMITITGSFANYQNVAPIRLQETEIATSSNNPAWCYAIGWGDTNGDTHTSPDYLQFTWLQLLSNRTCTKSWTLTKQMICAQYDNASVCSGDSGGPLVCNNRLVGITSFVSPGCPPSGVNVFGKVSSSSIISFIKKYMVPY